MLEAVAKGGWVMLPLVICSMVAVTVVIERFLFFKRTKSVERAEEIVKLVSNGQAEEAVRLAQGTQAPLLSVLAAGLTQHVNSGKAMEAAGIAEVERLKRGLPVLDTIITLSPLLGLLGTIVGMMNSFQIMAVAGVGQPHAITGGVAEALIATAVGITVAVTSLVPYNYFLARVEKETAAIEHYGTRLELALTTAVHRGDKYEDNKKYA